MNCWGMLEMGSCENHNLISHKLLGFWVANLIIEITVQICPPKLRDLKEHSYQGF